MNQFTRTRAAMLGALSLITLTISAQTTLKERSIAAIKKEMKLFKNALDIGRKCLSTRTCSPKERSALVKAGKHGTVILAIMATLGVLAYTSISKKPTIDPLLDLLRQAIEKQNDTNLTAILNYKSFNPKNLKDLLIIATQFGTHTAVQKLLDLTLPTLGESVFIDRKNTSLLHHAAVRAGPATRRDEEHQYRINIIDLLIKKGAPINHQSGEFQATALMQAAQTHNLELVKKLLDAGADIAIKDRDRLTARDWAIGTQAPDAILNLLTLPPTTQIAQPTDSGTKKRKRPQKESHQSGPKIRRARAT